MSKGSNRAKQQARRKPKTRRNARKRRKNIVGSFAGFTPAPMSTDEMGKFALGLIADQLLLFALKQTGIRDAFTKLLLKQLEPEDSTTPDAGPVRSDVEPLDSGGAIQDL